MIGEVTKLDYSEACGFLLPKHYSGRKPQITRAFGWLIDGELVAVCTFGKPASPALCVGICGKEFSQSVYELNRLCRIPSLEHPLSSFVAKCLRLLRVENWIVVSYSDTAMNHHGYIYQACNFMYTGSTKRRTDKYTQGNLHSRHYTEDDQQGLRKVRSSKHRYVFFCTSDKKQKRVWLENMNYGIEDYPKGDNSNYNLGEYLEPEIVPTEKK